MEGLKPYIFIHFTRTHGLLIAVFQNLSLYCSGERLLQSILSGRWSQSGHLRGLHQARSYWAAASPTSTLRPPSYHALLYRRLLGFHFRFPLNLISKITCWGKNCLLGKFTKPTLFSVLICSGIPEEMSSIRSLLKQSGTYLLQNSTGLGWRMKA